MVTGALGNVGGYVTKYAIKNGQEVVVAGMNMEGLYKKYEGNASCVYFDFYG